MLNSSRKLVPQSAAKRSAGRPQQHGQIVHSTESGHPSSTRPAPEEVQAAFFQIISTCIRTNTPDEESLKIMESIGLADTFKLVAQDFANGRFNVIAEDLIAKSPTTPRSHITTLASVALTQFLTGLFVKCAAFPYWRTLSKTPAEFDKQLSEQILKPLRAFMKSMYGIKPHHPATQEKRNAKIWEYRQRGLTLSQIGKKFSPALNRNAVSSALKQYEAHRQQELPNLLEAVKSVKNLLRDGVIKAPTPSVTFSAVTKALGSLVTQAESGNVMQSDTSICKQNRNPESNTAGTSHST